MRKSLFFFFFSFVFIAQAWSQMVPAADLSITKTVSAGPYFPNNLVYFTITARNNGPEAASNVVVTDLLPPGLAYMGASATRGTYNALTGTLQVGDLANGGELTLAITARITGPTGLLLSNTASITGTPFDPVPGNNLAVAQLMPAAVTLPNANLAVVKTISPGPYQAGDNVTYTVTVTNNSATPATNVSVADLLPTGLTFVQFSATLGSYNPLTGLYAVGSLAPNAAAILTLVATINTSGPLVNTASVSGLPADPDNTDNADTVQTCVLPGLPTRLEINGSAQTRNICAGQDFEFKVPVISGATAYNFTFLAGGNPSPDFTIISDLQSVKRIRVNAQATSGTVTLQVQAVNSCGASPVLTVPITVTALPAAPGPIAGPVSPCTGTSVTYTIPGVSGAAAYTWTLPAGWAVVSGETTPVITVRAGTGTGNISVKAANTCGGGSTSVLALSPVPTPATPVIMDISNVCVGLRYTVDPVANATAYQWTVPAGWTIESGQGTNTIAVKAPDMSATGLVTVEARNGTCAGAPAVLAGAASRGNGVLDFPNAFSPNGDGQNDTYQIGNLANFPDNDILIINRWGNQVFKQVNYQNNWIARDLNDGTYFYVLRVKACNDEQKIYRGYITVAR